MPSAAPSLRSLKGGRAPLLQGSGGGGGEVEAQHVHLAARAVAFGPYARRLEALAEEERRDLGEVSTVTQRVGGVSSAMRARRSASSQRPRPRPWKLGCAMPQQSSALS